jgi:hypothetical protein
LVHVTGNRSGCQVTYTPNGFSAEPREVTATYAGETGTPVRSGLEPSEGSATLVIANHPTSITLQCGAAPALDKPIACTALVLDLSSEPSAPTGRVRFLTSSQRGEFRPGSCTLEPVGASEPAAASCSVTFTPLVLGGVAIVGIYESDIHLRLDSETETVLFVEPAEGMF